MGAYLGYPQCPNADDYRLQQNTIKHLDARLKLLEKRMNLSEQNNTSTNEYVLDLEARVESMEKTADYVNTSIIYMQHSIDELIDEQFSKKT